MKMMKKQLLCLILGLLGFGLPALAGDPLQGKRIGVIGDSYVRNHRNPVEYTWHYKFAKKHGMQYFNYGRNGNCVSIDLKTWGPAMYKRYVDMADSLDYVIIIAGHNDASRLDSIGLDNYADKADRLLKGLKAKYPRAQVFWFTCWENEDPNFGRVIKATKKVCRKNHVACFDASRQKVIRALDDGFRDKYFQGKRRDHAHLNNAGHDLFLPVAEKFLLKHME